MEWPASVERVAAFLRDTGAEARLEELPTASATAAARWSSRSYSSAMARRS
jgi:hypothetical protein